MSSIDYYLNTSRWDRTLAADKACTATAKQIMEKQDMAIYLCNRCDNLKDADEDVCTEDPSDDTQLICEVCAEELEDESFNGAISRQ